jgi:hypothetical protein
MFENTCGGLEANRQAKLISTGLSAGDVRRHREQAAGTARVSLHRALKAAASRVAIHRDEGVAAMAIRRMRNFDLWVISPPPGAKSTMRQILKYRADIQRVFVITEGLLRELQRRPQHPEVSAKLAEGGRLISAERVRQLRKTIEKLEILGWGEAE